MCVALHDFALLRSKRTGFQKNAVGHPELSDVMKVGAPGKAAQFLLLPADGAGNFERIAAYTLGVSFGLVIPQIDGCAKRLQRVFIALFYALQGGAQLVRALGNHFFQVLAVVFDFLLQPSFAQSVVEAGDDRAFAERLDKIVVGAGAHGFDTHVHVVNTSSDEERHVRMSVTNFREKFHATEARHLKVGNDGVERLALQSYEGFFGSASGSAAKCRRREDEREKPGSRRFIVNGKNASRRSAAMRGIAGMVCGFLCVSLIGFVHCDVLIAPYCSTQGPVFSVKTHP